VAGRRRPSTSIACPECQIRTPPRRIRALLPRFCKLELLFLRAGGRPTLRSSEAVDSMLRASLPLPGAMTTAAAAARKVAVWARVCCSRRGAFSPASLQGRAASGYGARAPRGLLRLLRTRRTKGGRQPPGVEGIQHADATEATGAARTIHGAQAVVS
jgi:hypothetical protein